MRYKPRAANPTAMNTESIGVLAIGRRGWVEGYPTLPPALDATALGYHRAWWRHSTYFHADGYRYSVSAAVPARPLGAWSRMLAPTVYNPRVRVQFEYERAGALYPGRLEGGVRSSSGSGW
jgi:hypothetical protein